MTSPDKPSDVVRPSVLYWRHGSACSASCLSATAYYRHDLYDQLKQELEDRCKSIDRLDAAVHRLDAAAQKANQERGRYRKAIECAVADLRILCARHPLSDPGFTGVLINISNALSPQEQNAPLCDHETGWEG